MKKIINLSLLATLLVTGCYNSRSVTKAPVSTIEELPGENILFTDSSERKSTVVGYLNSISTRAMRDFEERYTEADKVKWYTIKNGYMAKYELEGIRVRVDYDRKGYWVFTMRTYHEKEMPREVRHIVKRTYYDDSINLIHEIKLPEKLVYLVYLQQGRKYTTVRVCNGEMQEIFKEYKNQL